MRRNNDGSIMIVTMGFVLVFTMMGMASIYFAGLQNEHAERKKLKAEAFWLADGGIELAKLNLNDGFTDMETVDENRSFAVHVNRETTTLPDGSDYTYQYRWKVRSNAQVHAEQKVIEAVFDNFAFPEFTPDDATSDEVGIELSDGTFQFQHIKASGSEERNNFLVTVASVSENVGGFLVVDARDTNADGYVPFFEIEGGVFSGVIAILGDVQITDFGAEAFGGDIAARVKGALYRNGELYSHDAIEYNAALVDKALALNGTSTGRPVMVAWNEE